MDAPGLVTFMIFAVVVAELPRFATGRRGRGCRICRARIAYQSLPRSCSFFCASGWPCRAACW
jgi:hypothetical protein